MQYIMVPVTDREYERLRKAALFTVTETLWEALRRHMVNDIPGGLGNGIQVRLRA